MTGMVIIVVITVDVGSIFIDTAVAIRVCNVRLLFVKVSIFLLEIIRSLFSHLYIYCRPLPLFDSHGSDVLM